MTEELKSEVGFFCYVSLSEVSMVAFGDFIQKSVSRRKENKLFKIKVWSEKSLQIRTNQLNLNV